MRTQLTFEAVDSCFPTVFSVCLFSLVNDMMAFVAS